jgi:hypothetical protein
MGDIRSPTVKAKAGQTVRSASKMPGDSLLKGIHE